MKNILNHILSGHERYESLSIVNHRYGSGWVAALTSAVNASEWLGIMADNGGDAPAAFGSLLSHVDVPIPVALGQTAEEALERLDAKLAKHPIQDDYDWGYRIQDLMNALEKHGCDWDRGMQDYSNEPWFQEFKTR